MKKEITVNLPNDLPQKLTSRDPLLIPRPIGLCCSNRHTSRMAVARTRSCGSLSRGLLGPSSSSRRFPYWGSFPHLSSAGVAGPGAVQPPVRRPPSPPLSLRGRLSPAPPTPQPVRAWRDRGGGWARRRARRAAATVSSRSVGPSPPLSSTMRCRVAAGKRLFLRLGHGRCRRRLGGARPPWPERRAERGWGWVEIGSQRQTPKQDNYALLAMHKRWGESEEAAEGEREGGVWDEPRGGRGPRRLYEIPLLLSRPPLAPPFLPTQNRITDSLLLEEDPQRDLGYPAQSLVQNTIGGGGKGGRGGGGRPHAPSAQIPLITSPPPPSSPLLLLLIIIRIIGQQHTHTTPPNNV